jgi:hypothetical protein
VDLADSWVMLDRADAARSVGGDISIKAYKFSEGFNAALAKQRFDTLRCVVRVLYLRTFSARIALC